MKVTRILHASVNAADSLDETRRFYANVLGLDPAERPDIPGVPGWWFTVADAEVHLVGVASAGAPAARGAIDPTAHHTCFAVDNLDAAVTELEAAAIPYVRAAQGAVTQIWITDPAGNTIELQQDPSVAVR